MTKKKILVADDELGFRLPYLIYLKQHNFNAIEASNKDEVFAEIVDVDLLMMDVISLPDRRRMNGMPCLEPLTIFADTYRASSEASPSIRPLLPERRSSRVLIVYHISVCTQGCGQACRTHSGISAGCTQKGGPRQGDTGCNTVSDGALRRVPR